MGTGRIEKMLALLWLKAGISVIKGRDIAGIMLGELDLSRTKILVSYLELFVHLKTIRPNLV